MEELNTLCKDGLITERMKHFYIIFELIDYGRDNLNKIRESYFMEEPLSHGNECYFSHQDGRLSIWREVTHAIKTVNECLIKLREGVYGK